MTEQPESQPFDLIVFDCDGVLIDSEVLSAEVLIAGLSGIGVVVDRDYVRTHFLGRSFPTVARLVARTFDVTLPPDFEAAYRRSLLARFDTELRPTPGIADVLNRLTMPACVATSSSPPRVARSLAIAGLADYFGAHVFTASQVPNGKPAPDLFLFAAAQMGAAPARTLVVEDSAPGVLAAQAAGMSVVGYTGGLHMRGQAIAGASPLHTFDNWADFPHLLSTLSPDGATP